MMLALSLSPSTAYLFKPPSGSPVAPRIRITTNGDTRIADSLGTRVTAS